jgi:hypothetical protein
MPAQAGCTGDVEQYDLVDCGTTLDSPIGDVWPWWKVPYGFDENFKDLPSAIRIEPGTTVYMYMGYTRLGPGACDVNITIYRIEGSNYSEYIVAALVIVLVVGIIAVYLRNHRRRR